MNEIKKLFQKLSWRFRVKPGMTADLLSLRTPFRNAIGLNSLERIIQNKSKDTGLHFIDPVAD